MKLSKIIQAIFASASIAFSISTLAMEQQKVETGVVILDKVNAEAVLMDKITQELINSENPQNKDPKKRGKLNKLIAQIKDINLAQNSAGYSLLHLGWINKSEHLFNLILNRKDLNVGLIFTNIFTLLKTDSKERVFSKKLIEKLKERKDPNWDVPQLAIQFTDIAELTVLKFIRTFMNKEMETRFARLIKNKAAGAGQVIVNSNIETAAGLATAQHMRANQEDYEKSKKKNEEIAQIERIISLYEKAVLERLDKEEIDLKGIAQIISKLEAQVAKLRACSVVVDTHTQKIDTWKKTLAKEEILQEKAQLFAKRAKERKKEREQSIFRCMKTAALVAIASINVKESQRVIKGLFFNQFDTTPLVTQAYTMQQIHRDPIWHMQYRGDATAIDARNVIEQELESYKNDAQAWLAAHKTNNKNCFACYNYARAMAQPAAQKQRRKSF
jgi:hypothetical protein